MATIKAFIRSSKSDKSKPANVRFRLSDGRLKSGGVQLFHKSELSVLPERWDDRQQKIKARVLIDEKERQYFDKAVTDRKNLIKNIYLRKGKTLTSELLDAEIDKVINPERHIIPHLSFFGLYDKFISNNSVAHTTLQKRRTVRDALLRFENYAKIKLDINTVTADTLKSLEKFLKKENKFSDNQPARSTNTISVMIKTVRTFFIWCITNEYTSNKPFNKYKIPPENYGDPYYLNIEELNTLYRFDLSDRPALEKQRDVFVFQSVIGCRISDLYKLNKNNIVDGAIQYIADKSKGKNPRTIVVPLNAIASEILAKYADLDGNQLLPLISMPQYNQSIKEVFTAAGLTRMVTVLNKLTGEKEMQPLNQVATSHLSRRTFCGILYKKTKNADIVCSMSGHSEGSKAFFRYRSVDHEMKTQFVKMFE